MQPAWSELLAAFPPGRVLVVSNSAGTKKDPGGIAVGLQADSWILADWTSQAESVSLYLRTPVLLHQTPKPGCAREIISYFRGSLGEPTSLRKRLADEAEKIKRLEQEDEDEILKRWLDEADNAPLLGPLTDSQGKRIEKGQPIEEKMMSKEVTDRKEEVKMEEQREEEGSVDDLRILVIGDRLFTDTLLAHRLSLLLPTANPSEPNIISIHTTSLPQPNDVRFLRWLEETLSRGKIKTGPND